MKAAIHARYGPPEVLQIADVPKPVPGKKDLLIKVNASTVNRTDCGFRSAEYFVSRFFSGLFKPKKQVIGNDFSGEIETVGTSVTMLKPGDKVFGYNAYTFGGHAEYLTIKENNAVVRMQETKSFQEP